MYFCRRRTKWSDGGRFGGRRCRSIRVYNAIIQLFCLFCTVEPLVSCGRSVYIFILLLFLQDKLLNKLDEKEQDEAKTPEEEVGSRLIRSNNNIMCTHRYPIIIIKHIYGVVHLT